MRLRHGEAGYKSGEAAFGAYIKNVFVQAADQASGIAAIAAAVGVNARILAVGLNGIAVSRSLECPRHWRVV